ncbi:MAG: helix-hairpin-helix domain-containing protein [Gemmatimonadota bacterium]
MAALPTHSRADDITSGFDDIALGDSFLRELLAGLDDESAAIDGLDELLREAAAFREHPVDVNTADLAELLRVPFLDPASAVRIVVRRDALGPAESLEELVARGCLSREALPAVRPYLVARRPPEAASPSPGDIPEVAVAATLLEAAPAVGAGGPAPPGDSRRPVTWELRLRATTQERWEAAWGGRRAAAGFASYARLRVSYADLLDLSVACEKDIGEENLTDHSAVCLVWRGGADAPEDGPAFSIGLGDFAGSWGQGLLLRSGGFPSEAGYPRRRDSVRRYDGAGESTSRRGAFVIASRGRVCVRAVLARTRLDAAIGEGGLATSIRTTGYHRTEGEREGALSLDESLVGVRVNVERIAGLELSVSLLRFGFSPELAPGDPVRQRFRFCGDELTAGGFDVRTSVGGLSAGCEVATTSTGGIAALAAARLRRGGCRVSAGGAYLARDYWSPLGGGVPGFSGGSNGAVGWVGAEYRSGADWKVWAASRVTRRPWRSYHSELPNDSVSVTIGGELRTKRNWRVAVESKIRARSDSEGDPTVTREGIVRRIRVSLRTEGSVPVTVSGWRVTSLSDGWEEGSLLAVALRIDGSIAGRSSYTAGLTSMISQGAVASLVQYEPRLPGEFGLTSLNVPGARWYIRVKTGLPAGLGLSVRLSGGPQRGQTQFGLGLDARG